MTQTKLPLAAALLLLALGPLRSEAAQPRPGILGVQVGMEGARARARLDALGDLERKERKRQEVWRVRDAHYSHLLVGFDAAGRVRYVTAVARPQGVPVFYSDVGDLRAATAVAAPGHTKYVWRVPGKVGRAGFVTTVHGTDPRRLATWSVERED